MKHIKNCKCKICHPNGYVSTKINPASRLKESTDDYLNDLMSKMELDIDNLLKDLQVKLDKEYQNELQAAKGKIANDVLRTAPPRIKSLPWFRNGIRGFLNKLWHGDSAFNPDWQSYQTSEHLTLEEYSDIISISESTVNMFMENADTRFTNLSEIPSYKAIIDDFKLKLKLLFKSYIVKARHGVTNWVKEPKITPPITIPNSVTKTDEEPNLFSSEPTETEPTRKKPIENSPMVTKPEPIPEPLKEPEPIPEPLKEPEPIKGKQKTKNKVEKTKEELIKSALSGDKKDAEEFHKKYVKNEKVKYKAVLENGKIIDKDVKVSKLISSDNKLIHVKYINLAINFMKSLGLDHNDPKQVKLIWPEHRNEPIIKIKKPSKVELEEDSPDAKQKFADFMAKNNIKPTTEVSITHSKFRKFINEESIDVKINYYKFLLENTTGDIINRNKLDKLSLNERINFYKNSLRK